MKSLKVSENAHRALKMYVASGKEDYTMEVIAGVAIFEYLRRHGYVYINNELVKTTSKSVKKTKK